MQVSQQTKKIRKQKFIMTLVKKHLTSDMQTIKKHSITLNTKLIVNYQTNIGILYQQRKLRTYPSKFWEPTNHTTKVLNDVSYVCLNENLAIALHKDDNMLNKRSEVISKCRHRNKCMLANYDSKN